MPFFKHEGHRLAYTSFGEGPRTCVLIHGLLLSQKMHRPLAKALAARGNRVVTLDLLGHGRSDRPRDMSRYSMSAFGEQVVGAARPPRASTRRSSPGTSLGANTALEVLSRGARARARRGDRDAGARQRAAGLRDRVHAADGGADVRRAGDARRRRGRARGPDAARPLLRRRRARHLRQDPAPSAAVLQGLFFGRVAPHRDASGARSRRRRWSSATGATRSTRSATPACSSTRCPTRGCSRPTRCIELRIAPRAADRRDRGLPRRVLEAQAQGRPRQAPAQRRLNAAAANLSRPMASRAGGKGAPPPGAACAQEEAERKARRAHAPPAARGRGAAGAWPRSSRSWSPSPRAAAASSSSGAVAVGLGELERQAAGAQDHRSRHGRQGRRLRREVVPARGPRPRRRRRSTYKTNPPTSGNHNPNPSEDGFYAQRRAAEGAQRPRARARPHRDPVEAGHAAERHRHRCRRSSTSRSRASPATTSCSSRTTRACRSRSPPPRGSTTSAARSGTRTSSTRSGPTASSTWTRAPSSSRRPRLSGLRRTRSREQGRARSSQRDRQHVGADGFDVHRRSLSARRGRARRRDDVAAGRASCRRRARAASSSA